MLDDGVYSSVSEIGDAEVVDSEVGRAADRGARVAARRPVGDALYLEVAHDVGKAEHDSVASRDLPAGGERRHPAREMLGKRATTR
jgi:hypothetical protein